MKNFRVLLMILGIISNICGCKSLTGPEFYYDLNTIASVEIVLLGEPVPESLTFEETVLSKIDNVAEFLSRINTVERRTNWGEPICITEGDVAVKIVYSSGEYDLLTYYLCCDLQHLILQNYQHQPPKNHSTSSGSSS